MPDPPAVVVTADRRPGHLVLAGSGNHRSVVFEFDDHLVLFEAPLNEARTKAVIDKARTLSAKPLTKAIVSHHHFDHSGGFRTAIAEGLTIVTHRSNETFFKALVARQHLIAPDALEKNHRQATFEFMDDRLTLKDKTMEVQLFTCSTTRERTKNLRVCPRDRSSCRPISTTPRGSGTPGARTSCRPRKPGSRSTRACPCTGHRAFDQLVKTQVKAG